MSADEPREPALTAIAAVARNGVIGDGRGLPWHIPEDFAHFKRATVGGVVIMGRRTYESLDSALPGRTSIVVTRNPTWYPAEGVHGMDEVEFTVAPWPGLPPWTYDVRGTVVHVADGVATALRILGRYRARRWWCAGGGQVYREFWPYVTDLVLTEVDAQPVGSVTFPDLDHSWSEQSRERHEGFDFVTYQRRFGSARDLLREACFWA